MIALHWCFSNFIYSFFPDFCLSLNEENLQYKAEADPSEPSRRRQPSPPWSHILPRERFGTAAHPSWCELPPREQRRRQISVAL